MKLYLLRSTWIMLGILLLLLVAGGILTKVLEEKDPRIATDEWRIALEEENAELEQEMADNEFLQSFNVSFIQENNFYLENDIQPTKYGALHFMYENSIFILLVGLFSIIVASGVIANEHRWGTIKLLLIRPISRTTILFSKYVSVLLFAVTTTIALMIGLFIVGLLLFGFEGSNPETLITTTDGSFELVSLYKEIFTMFAYPLFEIIILATMAFMISTVFKNNAMALATTLFFLFTGSQIYLWFEKYSWSKFILFAHTDLSQYSATGTPMVDGGTLSFSLMIIAVYYVLFLFLSWIIFAKRDVAGD